MSDPFFIELVGFKAGTVAGCAAPYTHTWILDTTIGTKTLPSFTTQIGMDDGTGGGVGIVRTLKGGIVNSANITVSVGELARVTLDTNYANESLTTALDACLNPMCVADFIPMTFAHGTLCFPAGTPVGEVQDVDITFSQNADHLWEIGNSVAVTKFKKLFEITGKFKASYVDTEQLQKIYAQQNDTLANTAAGAETLKVFQPTMTLVFTNGLAAAATRSITFSLVDIALDDHSVSIEPNEPIFEDINFQASSCIAVAVNATATKPAAS